MSRVFKKGKLVYCLRNAIILAAILSISTFAATLNDYRDRVQKAEEGVEQLLELTMNTSAKRETGTENTIITDIKKELPASEKIEWKATTAETGNQWFHDRLNEFQNEKDHDKRLAIIEGVEERLSSLLVKIKEIEAAEASARTKDEDKQKLAEILKREEYKPVEQKEESLFQRWVRRFLEWLDSLFPNVQKPEASSGGFQGLSVFIQVIIYAVVISLIAFVLYKTAPFLFGRFQGRVKKEKKERVILGERIGKDESVESLFGEAERLAREGDLRGAIRKGYIALLFELSERRIIGLAQYKTNRDYLRDVRGRGELYKNVSGLTASFERHWYGTQSAEANDWDEFRQGFRRAVES